MEHPRADPESGRAGEEDKRMMEWISVKDRLPTEETNVLVFAVSRYASGQEIFIDRMMQSKDGLIWVYTQNHYEITHWMPIPEPPKEG